MDSAPHSVAGRYIVERELGRGATATVYLAKDQRTGKAVAIKVLKRELAQSIGAERFLREIKLTAGLHHEHIVPVLDSGRDGEQLWFVLPFMKDGTLRDRMRRERQLPIDAAVEIARTVAAALDYAHEQGFIHRDVKPENILFSGDSVCLADFGIARAIERSLDESSTTTGIVRGTPAYMSPEQASGEHDYDGRTDIYSLACVLYEMIAGMPAFIGPTPKSVMAQRLLHPPRQLGVYRPDVPASLETTLQKALKVTPADRYASAADFSRALGAAMLDPTPASVAMRASMPPRWTRRNVALSLLAAGVAAMTLVTLKQWPEKLGIPVARADTSKIVVLPLEGDSPASLAATYDMLHQGLSRWKGVNVVDRYAVRDARGSERAVKNDREARETAQSVGAGRYVRARVSRDGSGLRLWSGLYDVDSRARLHEATIRLPADLSGADTAIERLTDALLLRRNRDLDAGSTVLPAVQLLDTAMRAIDAFSLRQADTLLLAALEADPSYGRAALWLAQVRNWKLELSSSWGIWAERASADPRLTQREKRFARALVAMVKREYPAACQIYDSARALDNQDFATWYGLGQCHRLDVLIIPDRTSPSRWRFRGSSHQAATSYARALELAPALHASFEARAYSRLRDLLYTRRSIVRRGRGPLPDTIPYLGYASWSGDSLVHIPYPEEMVTRGMVKNDPNARAAAVVRQRELFQRLAQSWAAALPESPGTKEAVALSLESTGDTRAIDTLRLGRSLARDEELRTRLGAEEVLMRVTFGRRDPGHLAIAVALADSLLASRRSITRDEAAILAPIAALVGRCHAAASFAARSITETQAAAAGQPIGIVAASESLTVLAAMGCGSRTDSATMRAVLDDAVASPSREKVEYELFARAASLSYPLDTVRVARLARQGDYVLEAQLWAARGRADSVRSILERKFRVRPPAEVSPDAVYAEARALIQVGVRQRAKEWMDPVLHRPGWLELMVNDAIGTGSLMRAAALRAELANAERDSRRARQWAGLVAVLWSNPDAELRPIARRMSVIAGRK